MICFSSVVLCVSSVVLCVIKQTRVKLNNFFIITNLYTENHRGSTEKPQSFKGLFDEPPCHTLVATTP